MTKRNYWCHLEDDVIVVRVEDYTAALLFPDTCKLVLISVKDGDHYVFIPGDRAGMRELQRRECAPPARMLIDSTDGLTPGILDLLHGASIPVGPQLALHGHGPQRLGKRGKALRW